MHYTIREICINLWKYYPTKYYTWNPMVSGNQTHMHDRCRVVKQEEWLYHCRTFCVCTYVEAYVWPHCTWCTCCRSTAICCCCYCERNDSTAVYKWQQLQKEESSQKLTCEHTFVWLSSQGVFAKGIGCVYMCIGGGHNLVFMSISPCDKYAKNCPTKISCYTVLLLQIKTK